VDNATIGRRRFENILEYPPTPNSITLKTESVPLKRRNTLPECELRRPKFEII
jgi:hypothetical protein